VLAAAIAELRPQLVLCVGQAGGRAQVSVERVALNLADARIPDNAGMQPTDSALIANAPHAYFAALPVKQVVERLHAAGIPAEISHHAGNFVCNAVLYALCHHIAHHAPDLRGGFIHLPFLPEQARERPNMPSMALATMIEALRVAIAAAIET
jgi:pyroglutamyl-peptidase